MPTYVLECTECGEKFSIFASMKDRDKLTCPKCGNNKLKQDYSSVFVGGKAGSSSGSSFSSSSCGGSGGFS